MWQWISGLDVNAVFAAVLAAWAYIHNHSFRKQVAIARGDIKPPTTGAPSAGAATLAIVLVVVGVVLVLSAIPSCHTPKGQAVLHAEEVCIPEDLQALRDAIAAAKTQQNAAAEVVAVVTASIPALICAGQALGAEPPPEVKAAAGVGPGSVAPSSAK